MAYSSISPGATEPAKTVLKRIGEWDLPILAAVVILLRLPFFNSPAIHIDEQFYLTVADKWIHHGLIPFVDIWDRKPIGTFILYVLPVVLFDNGILAYQILAAAFVIATGAIVLRIGRQLFTKDIGFAAALIYAVAVMLMEGPGGQTPVFYNLFVSAAVALYLSALISHGESKHFGLCILASLFLGIAIQIKYICAIEAAVLSVLMLAGLRTLHRWTIGQVSWLGLAMIGAGLLPTVLVAVSYAAAGHFVDFWDANFVSIFSKRLWHLSPLEYAHRLLESSLFCSFFLPFAGFSLISILRAPPRGAKGWGYAVIIVWLVAALPGALGLGNPTRHYFLPTLVPLSILTAVGLQRAEQVPSWFGRALRGVHSRWGRHATTAGLLLVPAVASFVISQLNLRERGDAADVYAVAAYIKAHNPSDGCPFVFNRLPILYYLADVCAPSVYLFPNHLSEIAEVQTPGKERLMELRRVLKLSPPLIYVRRPYSADLDPDAISLLEQTLRDHYVLDYVRRGYRQVHAVYARASEHGLD